MLICCLWCPVQREKCVCVLCVFLQEICGVFSRDCSQYTAIDACPSRSYTILKAIWANSDCIQFHRDIPLWVFYGMMCLDRWAQMFFVRLQLKYTGESLLPVIKHHYRSLHHLQVHCAPFNTALWYFCIIYHRVALYFFCIAMQGMIRRETERRWHTYVIWWISATHFCSYSSRRLNDIHMGE